MVCSVLANIHRDTEKRRTPFVPADFLPGAKTEDDDMREFAEAVLRGDKFAPPSEEEMKAFREQLSTAFNPPAPRGGRVVNEVRQ